MRSPHPTARRTALAVAAIALAAFAFRIWVVAEVATREPGGGDPLYYHLQANLLADGHGFAEPFRWQEAGEIVPSAIHPPGFTVWLAAASVAGFDTVFAHKVMSALAGAITVALVGALGFRLAGPSGGVGAALLAAAHPNLWIIDGALMPEALFGMTVAAVLLIADVARRRDDVWSLVALGASIGAATLVRGEALLFVPLLAGWLALRGDIVWAMRLRRVAVVGAAAAAVIAPWTIRNLVTFDVPVLLSANGDEVIRNANCDLTWDGRLLGFWAVECYQPVPPADLDEAARARFWRNEGLRFVRDNIDRAPVVAAARVGRVWDLYRPGQNVELSTVEGRNLHVARAGQIAYVALVPTAVVGAFLLRRQRVPLWPYLSTIVVVTVTAVYAYGVIRFRVPAEVALVVLGGVAVGRGAERAIAGGVR
ncbi:MAG TPA: glycosyltransferase family 39 protein [Acidimicrobiales bacterium]|nr:glycosyltransferase family 39 protein [Acidimicrobiales bacterium]